MDESDSWTVDGVREGWARVHAPVAAALREAGAEVAEHDGGDLGTFPLVRTWAMDLYGQRWRLLPDRDESGGRGRSPEECAAGDAALAAVVRRCAGLDEEGAREVMRAAFSAYLLGGTRAVLALGSP